MKRKGAAKFSTNSSSPWKPNWKKDIKGKEEASTKIKGKIDSQPSRNREIKCFKCLGAGHIAFQSPNKRTMVIRDNGELATESESESMPSLEDADDEGIVYLDVGEILVTRRALNS